VNSLILPKSLKQIPLSPNGVLKRIGRKNIFWYGSRVTFLGTTKREHPKKELLSPKKFKDL
jgi:hypothetical protein